MSAMRIIVLALALLLPALSLGQAAAAGPKDLPPMPDPCTAAPNLPLCR
jgi:hypothetical protein